MQRKLITISLLFVLLSFIPSFWEIYKSSSLPKDRTFLLEHNYLFDYNFYLSRIREGQEGRLLVSEKYYNLPHPSSLFQILYLSLGKIGGILKLSSPDIYHLARFTFGFLFLYLTGRFIGRFFRNKWQIFAFLLVVTGSSWPILLKVGDFWRFAGHMGWWSAIDSLQRITFIPHVVFGQMFILLFIWRYSRSFHRKSIYAQIGWGFAGFALGIIFPPTLLVVYVTFAVMTIFEGLEKEKGWFSGLVVPRIIFILLSISSFIYLRMMFSVSPWSELALFDVKHRTLVPYWDYALALGPCLPFGILGLITVFVRRNKKFIPLISWVFAVALLFILFEYVPEQSPLRFTEASINIPLGILSLYFFYAVVEKISSRKKSYIRLLQSLVYSVIIFILLMGFGVMVSSLLWQTDQAEAKRQSGWLTPVGTQIAYPLKDFMDAIAFLDKNTEKNSIVLTYITAGNYIPAYAGNYVYIGHANTPGENDKEKIAERFYKGEMGKDEVEKFLRQERISSVFFGPQERSLGGLEDLERKYPFLQSIYQNKQVMIYKTF